MKNILFLLFVLIFSKGIAQHEHQITKTDTTKPKPKSPLTSAMAMVNNNHVHIEYSSPSVRGRSIWNGLVAYGQVWATGAHKATWIEFSEDVTINAQLVSKGKYGFFTIPNKKEWILIISKDWNMHLADNYKAENDVIRLNVKPKKTKTVTESLTYNVKALKNKKGQISMSWEYLTISFDFDNVN